MCGMMGLLTDSTLPRLGELVYHTVGNLEEQWGPEGVGSWEVRGLVILQHKGSSRRFPIPRAVL